MNYIVLKAPNRLTSFIIIDKEYPTIEYLESIRDAVKNNNWCCDDILEQFTNFKIITYLPYNNNKVMYYIIYGANIIDTESWLHLINEANNCIDPHFMIFISSYYNIERISENLKAFL